MKCLTVAVLGVGLVLAAQSASAQTQTTTKSAPPQRSQSKEERETSSGTSIQDHAEDVRAIEKILAETSDAWNRHDAEGLVAHSTDDIDHIGVNGHWSRGKSDLRAQFAAVVPRISNTVTGSIERIRFVSPDIAVAIIRREYKSATETRIAIGTSVFQRIKGEWLVTAFQNTYVQ